MLIKKGKTGKSIFIYIIYIKQLHLFLLKKKQQHALIVILWL